MLKWPMIHKRGEVYYLRLTVPLRVQAAYGKKDVWVSLRTRNLDEARVLALAASAKIKATFRRLEGHTVSMEPDELATLYQRRALAEDAQYRLDASLKPRKDDEDETDERESLALTARLDALEDDPSRICWTRVRTWGEPEGAGGSSGEDRLSGGMKAKAEALASIKSDF